MRIRLQKEKTSHELRDLKANIDIVKKSEKEITNVDILRRLSQLEKYIYDKDE